MPHDENECEPLHGGCYFCGDRDQPVLESILIQDPRRGMMSAAVCRTCRPQHEAK